MPAISEHKVNISEYSATLLLMLLVCADLVFIFLHLVHALTRFLNSWYFNFTWYQSYAEVYQYIKWLWIIILLVNLSRLKRSFAYLAWVLVFLFFLGADVFSIHLIFGNYLAENLSLMFAFELGLQDFALLVVAIAAAMVLPTLVGYAYLLGTPDFKIISRDILLLILALVFFGIFVDMSYDIDTSSREIVFVFGTIENSGEMLVVSLILWYSFLVSVRDEHTCPNLYEFIRNSLTRSRS